MSHEPEYKDWQQIIELIRTSMGTQQDDMLLTMLMSRDERESLISRVNIINELLKGELSQRQISQMLGVGIATITRGSNELKSKSDEEKDKLKVLLEQVAVSK
ncbi:MULTISPECIES: trp operon repressor [Vibrio]|jgi:TrpR family trp operon transcriptional repressor|uniref:Trp operon repressor homolog n=2 Tax=Vibrio alginolyticus TaxID=663 RepID=A0A0H0Y7L2_VIBAL|nr:MULTISPECIES: trp operon repressor [Vibrio]EEZ83027.1 Trp operon repressor [Vibrio alginolyticus 40B]MDW1812240.1 trp operon repressor [Vibrio sp. Vb2362]MDW1971953.1 trp operon repressor [Vibrio sp. 945]MDW2258793.1 trp operon repressor [Vibrio sp. 1409]MDW2297692.1 trp operon repressor [Vibrio sp. 1404]NAW52998.1 trp operon repressor [Vibrio sp. V41_P2S12T139]NAW93184.1 trp operon repressor [Vibrio sp. V42_P2S4T144]QCO85064.1 trp operon repressor [Vibrio neocaledonicus]QIR87659.1 trp 